MSVLITGASGFVGSHLIKKINNKNIILISSKKRAGFIKVDIHKKKFDILNKYNIDTCIHLAWSDIPNYSKKNSYKNYLTSKELFKYLLNRGCKKIISLGSCWEYRENYGKKNEKNDKKSENIFGYYKKKLAYYGLNQCKKKNAIFTWLRVFYVYGDKKKGLLKYLVNCEKFKEKIILKNPYKINDFIFIEDIVQCILLCVKKNYHGIYNLGSGNKITTMTFCKNFLKIKKNKKKFYLKYNKKVNKNGIWACMKKTEKVIGFLPRFNLKNGIKKSLKYIN
jgi:nucleoside-diphosphate-sugar epimerase